MVSYFVCSTRRTGSSLLCAGLEKLHCGVPVEYFNVHSPSRIPIYSRGAVKIEDYLKGVLEEATTPNGVCGVKIQWDDFKLLRHRMSQADRYRPIPVSEALNQVFPNLKYIHIRRRDKVRQAISLEKALKSNIWVVPLGQASPSLRPLKYNYFSLYQQHQRVIRADAAWVEYFRRYSIRPLEIFYEDMVEAYGDTLRKVLRFLQIETMPGEEIPPPPLERLSDELSESWYKRYKRTPVSMGKFHAAWQTLRKNVPAKHRLLFVSNASFYPESVGGTELSHLYLLQSLKKRGWSVEIICTTKKEDYQDMDLGFMRQAVNVRSGLFSSAVQKKIKEFCPGIVLGHEGGPGQQIKILKSIVFWGTPTFCYVHNLDILRQRSADIRIPPGIHFMANAPFTAQTLGSLFPGIGRIKTIFPAVEREKYETERRNPLFITLINPIPAKGVGIALEVASKMPQERFLFVKARWAHPGRAGDEAWLKKADDLPNITVWDVQEDMRRVYAVTDILLAPSQFIETYGRMIVEAHINGIPVIASNVGGVSYTMGKGGILVDPKDDVDQYVAAIQSLKTNRNLYGQLSREALQNSRRLDFNPEYQVDQFVAYVEEHSKGGVRRPGLAKIVAYYVDGVKEFFRSARSKGLARPKTRSRLYQNVLRLFGPEFAECCALFYARAVPGRMRAFVQRIFK